MIKINVTNDNLNRENITWLILSRRMQYNKKDVLGYQYYVRLFNESDTKQGEITGN